MSLIKIEETSKRISGLGGIIFYRDLLERLSICNSLKDCLPVNLIEPKVSSGLDKFLALTYGFISGAEHLEDMELLGQDSLFPEIVPLNKGNTYSRYLYEFTPVQVKELNKKLIETSLKLRKASHGNSKEFVLDIDSTTHVQHGSKMEGLGWDYKNQWGLDSIQAYDEYGYEYWMEVREGGTFSSNGASEIIHEVFRRIPKNIRKYFRGDSAFCNVDVFKANFLAGVKFVIAMRENMFRPLLKRVTHWKKSGLYFKDREFCEIGESIYYPKEGIEPLRVVIIRAPKVERQKDLFEEDAYDYYAFVTNMGCHVMSAEKLIKFYRKRGNAENFIKEQKYGFDLRHLPCQKLTANKAYAVIAAFAYTLMRHTAFLISKKKTPFSKRIRFLLVNLPCEVIKHARSVIVRFSSEIYEEVLRFQSKLKIVTAGL